MRKNIKYTVLTIATLLCFTAFGCDEVQVTNVDDYLTPPEGSVALTAMAQNDTNTKDAETDTSEPGENENENNDENAENANIEDNDLKTNENEDVKTEDADDASNENDSEEDNTQKENDDIEDDTDTDDNSEGNDDSNVDDVSDGEQNEEQNPENQQEELIIPDTFDVEFYARTYPDVVEVFGDSPEALYKHYLDYGLAEGRMASENADVIPESEDNAN